MSSMLASNESIGLLLNASSPTNPTFQPSFPLQHIPDMNFSQGNNVSMTSYPTFMNSAYSQESKQINNLQEHTKFLEAQVMRLTIENNTLRCCLAGSVGLQDMDSCQVDARTSFSQASKPKEELCPTWENYPSIQFWYWEDWDKYLKSPEGQGKLMNWQVAPTTWGRFSASSHKFIHKLMENNYLMFKFVHNRWKLDYLASTNYPAWQKMNLDNSGRWKLKKCKGPKLEDEDNSTDEIGKKRKLLHHTFKSEELEKKFRGMWEGDDNITWSSSATSLSPPSSNLSTSLGSVQLSSELSLKDFPPEMLKDLDPTPFCDSLFTNVEKESIQCGVDTPTTASNLHINPLDALTAATNKTQEILPPPSVDVSQGSQSNFKAATETQLGASPILELADAILLAPISTVPAVPEDNSATSVSKSAKGSTKAKMHLGPTKNGWYVEHLAQGYHSFLPRNLCTHHWHKQIQSSGSTEEFQKYYNSLAAEQQKAYDDKATMLVTSNNWDTKSICNSILH
ncbi:hypothetical protein V8B97DRAFT_2025549 [Scleroderma yunnanense]